MEQKELIITRVFNALDEAARRAMEKATWPKVGILVWISFGR